MRYIENEELREWVKESLRKTIFQKAHALAVQTGCEILVKLKDAAGVYTNPLYYASDSYQESYRKDGVREEPGEMFVSGETGLPIFPLVDSSTQSDKESCDSGDQTRIQPTDSSVGTLQDITDDGDSAIPMQLSLATETRERLKPKQETDDATNEETTQDSLSNVVVKLERLDEEEVNNRLSAPDGGDDMLGEGLDTQGSFEEMDNSFGADQGELNASISARPYPIMSPKPYQCGVCGKAFRSVQVLQKHTQTFHMRPQMGVGRSRGRGGRGLYHGRPGSYRQLHTSQARFLCVMCNRSFRSPDLLQDHMTRSHMTQATPVQLSQSQETFDPSTAQTSQAPATATLQSLQHQQEQQLATGISFQSPDDPNAQVQMSQSDPSAFNVSAANTSGTFIPPMSSPAFKYQEGLSPGASTSAVGVPQSTATPSRFSGKDTLKQLACFCEERRERDKQYEKNKRIRRFNTKWQELNPWLEYDEENDVMYCSWCRQEGIKGLGKASNSFFKGTNSFRTSSILSHVTSKNHHKAVAQRYAKGATQDLELMDTSTGATADEETIAKESSEAADEYTAEESSVADVQGMEESALDPPGIKEEPNLDDASGLEDTSTLS